MVGADRSRPVAPATHPPASRASVPRRCHPGCPAAPGSRPGGPCRDPTRPTAATVCIAAGALSGGADSVFRGLASAGLILLIALIGAALLTWRAYSSYYSTYYHDYFFDEVYSPLALQNSILITSVLVVIGVLAAIGVVLMLVAERLRRTRRRPAGRLASAGGALVAFALFTYAWAIHNGSLAGKRDEMTLVALVGAALLLAGCWRGISPSKRNVAWLVWSGIGVIVLAIVGHFVWSPWVLGAGFAGLISGIALTSAGLVLAVRRRRLAKQEQ